MINIDVRLKNERDISKERRELWAGFREQEQARRSLHEYEKQEMEKRRTLLTDNINGKNITDCKICGEYLDKGNCPLVNYSDSICEKSFLYIRKNLKTKKYIITQFGIK
jgi:hypothetical protein